MATDEEGRANVTERAAAKHRRPPVFASGFIGVDVFFVISGYLITRNLLAQTDERDRVRPLDFW